MAYDVLTTFVAFSVFLHICLCVCVCVEGRERPLTYECVGAAELVSFTNDLECISSLQRMVPALKLHNLISEILLIH